MNAPADWPSIFDAALARNRFSPITVRYWGEWLDSRGQYPPTEADFLDFIAKMEYSIGEALSDMIPSHFIDEEDNEPPAPAA
jgi:hypothetical protein